MSAPAHPPVERRALRAYELPHALGVSKATVTKLLNSGALPSFLVGRCRFVTVADLDRWLAAQRDAAG